MLTEARQPFFRLQIPPFKSTCQSSPGQPSDMSATPALRLASAAGQKVKIGIGPSFLTGETIYRLGNISCADLLSAIKRRPFPQPHIRYKKKRVAGYRLSTKMPVSDVNHDETVKWKGSGTNEGIQGHEYGEVQRCAYDMLFCYGHLSSMCTTFAATGSATRKGKTIIGRNIDFSGDWPFELLKTRHADGLEQLALCVGGVEWEVLNSNGFCNSDHDNYPNSICRHPDANAPSGLLGETLASVIMVPDDRKMYIAYGHPCQCEFATYGL
jgi:hypothetical protein